MVFLVDSSVVNKYMPTDEGIFLNYSKETVSAFLTKIYMKKLCSGYLEKNVDEDPISALRNAIEYGLDDIKYRALDRILSVMNTTNKNETDKNKIDAGIILSSGDEISINYYVYGLIDKMNEMKRSERVESKKMNSVVRSKKVENIVVAKPSKKQPVKVITDEDSENESD
jgi:hypothetical protein